MGASTTDLLRAILCVHVRKTLLWADPAKNLGIRRSRFPITLLRTTARIVPPAQCGVTSFLLQWPGL